MLLTSCAQGVTSGGDWEVALEMLETPVGFWEFLFFWGGGVVGLGGGWGFLTGRSTNEIRAIIRRKKEK